MAEHRTGRLRADLHAHGLIGFHDFWIKKQVGNLNSNLLKLIAEECFRKGVSLLAITSQYEPSQAEDSTTGLIHTRLKYLINEAERLPQEYKVKIGNKERLLFVEKASTGESVSILASQSVGARRIPGDDKTRVDNIVIGREDIPPGNSLDDTLALTNEQGLITIAEHPTAPALFSIGKEEIREYMERYDALEWNAQMCIPSVLRHIPVAGRVISSAVKRNNTQVLEIAKRSNKQVVYVSDAHRIQDIGAATIDIEEGYSAAIQHKLREGDEDSVLTLLKKAIREKKFTPNPGYAPITGLFQWRGIYKGGLHKLAEPYGGMENLPPEGQRQKGDHNLGYQNLIKKGFLKKAG